MDVPARYTALLLAAAAAVYLLGNGRVGLWDRDEPRYAQCSRQMLQSRDWVVPRLYDELRAKKPPLIYWCEAAAMKVLGDDAFAARLPSSLAMIVTLTLLAVVIGRKAGGTMAFWTTLVFASALWTVLMAKMCLTDSVLLLWTMVAQLCLYAMWRGSRSWGVVVTMGVALGLAGLTKGPFGPGVVLATLLALGALRWLDRWLAGRRPRPGSGGGAEPLAEGDAAPGGGPPVLTYAPPNRPRTWAAADALGLTLRVAVVLALIAAFVVPWVLLVRARAPQFLTLIRTEAAGHLAVGMEGHGGPPGMQFGMVWFTFLPWSLLMPLAIVLGWKGRNEPETRFALAAVIGPWLMTELIKTKLPHYLLPTFPPLAFLVARAIVRCVRGEQRDLESPAFLFFAGVWAAVVLAVGVLPCLAAWKHLDAPWPATALVSAAAAAYAGLVLGLFHTRRPGAALLTMGLGVFALFGVLYGVYFPRAAFLRLSERAAAVLRREGATEPGGELMIDYKEPSLAFYQGGTIREHRFADPPPSFFAPGHAAEWPRWVVITGEAWGKASPLAHDRFREVARFHGLAYADGGRIVDVLVLRNLAPGAAP